MEAWLGLLRWLEDTNLAEAMRGSPWLYPAVETGHILGFSLLVGASAMFDLRLLGMSRQIPVRQMAAHLLPWAWVGFAVAAPTGFLLLLPEAAEIGGSTVFLVKISLIALAGLNALVFHTRVGRSVAGWEQNITTPLSARLAAVLSLLVWAGVVTAGRLIAYLD